MSSLSYIAITGRQPELGLVELESILGAEDVQPFGRYAAMVSTKIDIDSLGGVMKFGEVLYRGEAASLRHLPLDEEALPVNTSKTPFAISAYGSRETPKMLISAGLELKKRLRARGSVRFVAPGSGLAVTAAELRHNRVLQDGFELLVVLAGQEMVIARTIGVQNIDWYSRRDYDRPARSAKVGMLPPKLAQVLLNTTPNSAVYDPFCGTGVVLQEALLMGRTAKGSDISEAMVEASRVNLPWLAGEVAAPLPGWDVELLDARDARISPGSSIVSEGYLGPNLTRSPGASELKMIRAELLGLYIDVLSKWSKQQQTGDSVSICVPCWRTGTAWNYLGLVDELGNLGYTLKGFKHVRTPLLYARADQIVGRQLLLLRKN